MRFFSPLEQLDEHPMFLKDKGGCVSEAGAEHIRSQATSTSY
jgi:hypothetical protein